MTSRKPWRSSSQGPHFKKEHFLLVNSYFENPIMSVSTGSKFRDVATFGFEVEFLVLFRESGTKFPLRLGSADCGRPPQQVQEEPYDLSRSSDNDHEVHMKRLHYFGSEIAKKLTEAGIITAFQEKGHPKAETPSLEDREPRLGYFDKFCYTSYKENSIVPEETMIWTDPTANGKRMAVRPETPEGYFWLGFEFVSKVYRYRDIDISKSDLAIMCRTLRAEYFVSINAGKESDAASSRCGTHIHWGLSGAEYDLLTVKRVLTFMWVAEEMLMGLHATWRQSATKYDALLQRGTNMATDNISKLPSWTTNLGKGDWIHEMEQNVPPRVRGSLHCNKPKIQWIWRAETVNDLAMFVGEAKKSRRASVGITELLPATSSFPGKVRRSQLNTIEFRHMQASLHPTLIAAWISVTAEIMSLCVDSSPEDFASILEDAATYVSDKNSTVQELLNKLRVSSETCSVFRSFDQQRLNREADSRVSMFLPEL
ncbi:hypothetical protein F5Y06DRAFT_293312 [Hypoxylon sp. FL0890]|nr:hypothetical protein F5Y06DRAFT_293312 [Hypoxylon sp. FL0890]